MAFIYAGISKLSGPDIGKHFEGGCCGACQHLGAKHRRQVDGGITGVVSGGRIMLFVAWLMLLINDDQAQVLKRKKHGRPGPQHQVVTDKLIAGLNATL